MASQFTRQNDRKNWSEIYCQKIEKINSNSERSKQKKDDAFIRTAMQGMVASRIVKNIKNRKKKNNIIDLKIGNVTKETSAVDIMHSMCALCLKPCLNEIVNCVDCHEAVHLTCSIKQLQRHSSCQLSQYGIYLCDYCVSYQSSESKRLSILQEAEKIAIDLKNAANFICSWIVRRKNRKEAEKKRKSAKIIFNFFLTSFYRCRFLKWRKKQLRVVTIKIPQALCLDSAPLLTITVLDSFTKAQIFQYERNPPYVEPVFLPGITGEVLIVITLGADLLDDDIHRFKPVLQATLPLRDIQEFVKHGSYSLTFSKKISWNVGNFGENFKISSKQPKLHSISEYECGKNFNIDTNLSSFQINVNVMSLYKAFCGVVQGPVVEVLTRSSSMWDSGRLAHRSTLYWVCLCGLSLHFFGEYGDSTPFSSFDIKDTTIKPLKDSGSKGKPLTLIIIFSGTDQRWNLSFQTPNDALRFEMVYQAGQRSNYK